MYHIYITIVRSICWTYNNTTSLLHNNFFQNRFARGGLDLRNHNYIIQEHQVFRTINFWDDQGWSSWSKSPGGMNQGILVLPPITPPSSRSLPSTVRVLRDARKSRKNCRQSMAVSLPFLIPRPRFHSGHMILWQNVCNRVVFLLNDSSWCSREQ